MRLDKLKTLTVFKLFRILVINIYRNQTRSAAEANCLLVKSGDKLLMILVMSPKMGPVSKLVSQKFWAFGTLKLHVWSVSADNVNFAVSLGPRKMSTYLANT